MVKILALGGDGIGPEILDQGLSVANRIAQIANIDIEWEHGLLHGASYEAHGTFCSEKVLAQARNSDAVLVGAVGGPRWDNVEMPGGPECQDGLMFLRYHLQTYLGLRPAWSFDALLQKTPFRADILNKTDILILREMCGGAMFAKERGQRTTSIGRQGYDMICYDEEEISRFAVGGFELARKRRQKLTSCDKSNVMHSYKLWREIVTDISKSYLDVQFENMFADNFGYQMIMRPDDFDVVLCCNQLGDIFSDLTGTFSGSLGMLPSACLASSPSAEPSFGIYESTAGSAPDIAGKGIANPIGTILAVGMMFKYTFQRPDLAFMIQSAVEKALNDGIKTLDIGGNATSEQMTKAIEECLTK
jgi:3-isopropylmalate dehydrogenase